MSRSVLRRSGRWALWGLAAVAVVVAVALIVVAVDVLRSPDELRRDDTRFQAAPMRQAGLWDVGFLPREWSERLLGLEDDVTFRRAAGMYLRVEPSKVDFRGFPELEALRAKAQFEVTRLSRTDPDLERRSRLLVMYGVMTLDGRTLNDDERQKMLQNAVSAFRNAITFDPENEDAKRNLETALRVFGPVALSGTSPQGGKSEGEISGQGTIGSGY